MSLAEETLYNHITNVESLDFIADSGLAHEIGREVIPTEVGRKLVAWCLDEYFASHRTVAPSKAAIMETWGDRLEAVDITIDDEVECDSVQWAIGQLRVDYARWRSQELVKEIAQGTITADPDDVVEEVQKAARSFYLLSQSLISRRAECELGTGIENALIRYDRAVQVGQKVIGLTFGLDEIDQYYGGVRPGELAILAAFSGVGKSWMAAKALLAEWERGRKAVLFTLENDLDMTFDRLACMAASVSYTDWNNLEVPAGDRDRVSKWSEKIKASEHKPMVIMGQRGEVDPVSMVRKARLLSADSIIVDQLSHMDSMPGWRGIKHNENVAEKVRGLSQEIRGEYDALPCLLLHQINREGDKEAAKSGKLEMRALADSSEVEKSATFVYALFQSPQSELEGRAEWQTLKVRRGQFKKRWELIYRLERGDIRVHKEVVNG